MLPVSLGLSLGRLTPALARRIGAQAIALWMSATAVKRVLITWLNGLDLGLINSEGLVTLGLRLLVLQKATSADIRLVVNLGLLLEARDHECSGQGGRGGGDAGLGELAVDLLDIARTNVVSIDRNNIQAKA